MFIVELDEKKCERLEKWHGGRDGVLMLAMVLDELHTLQDRICNHDMALY